LMGYGNCNSTLSREMCLRPASAENLAIFSWTPLNQSPQFAHGAGLAKIYSMKIRVNFAAILFALALASCGYRLAGTETHPPAGMESVFIDIADNRTGESGLEQDFTQALVLAFKSDGRIKLTDKKDAQAVLKSELIDVLDQPVAFDRFGRANLVQVTVSSRVYLLRPGAGEKIWDSGIITETEQYPASDDFLANDALRGQALVQTCRRAAAIALDQLAGGF